MKQGSRSLHRRPSATGQSVVEFALVLPILAILMLAIVDLARIYTTMVSVESAAREAADFGSFGSQKWDAAAVAEPPPDGTEDKMRHRACVAASDLPGLRRPRRRLHQPRLLVRRCPTDRGATWVPYDAALGCDDPDREPPCWLRVTLEYDFHLLRAAEHRGVRRASTASPSHITLAAPERRSR